MSITYTKQKNNARYFIEIDGIRIVSHICEELNMSFEEYINVLQMNGGLFSNKIGWYFPSEEKAFNCCVMLNLLKK